MLDPRSISGRVALFCMPYSAALFPLTTNMYLRESLVTVSLARNLTSIIPSHFLAYSVKSNQESLRFPSI
jgi:hypothetical protein